MGHVFLVWLAVFVKKVLLEDKILSPQNLHGYKIVALVVRRLDNATEVHTHIANVKEYRCPGYLPNLRPLNFCGKSYRQFTATISLRKFQSSPQTKIWLLWQFIYADTSAKPCMCSEAINNLQVSGEKANKYKSEGNFSHIKKAPDRMWDLGLMGVT